ncbi:hypothetical protein BU26DRAFT_42052 [Trematosphaeria pertusa]|uniref:Uncharacterized protein n=1 Tax=Trematosphaeria pertusa TaxID=390896 RepID=A0A6A6J3W7_9PLEO|nr:uncharacterized protein BU26DRAFT_42052 [Trematosphaeria pertusa]KAF2257336.1 hypothetical protein BU26DRAFT_42052 [Trematosphaeria pertusa]
MQVHAVPDSERAFDSTGRRLPWAFEYADSEHAQRRVPEEKGPFGKARKRGVSRSKTPTVRSEEDKAKLDNLRTIDDIFLRHKADTDKQKSLSGRKPSGTLAGPPVSASAPNLLEAGGLSTSFQPGASATNALKEPKEVILYGYGSEVQWAALDFYEKVSSGIIYEEYDREPPGAKYGLSFSQQRASSYVRSLSKSARAKVNEFVGGDHWIKVTFDSAEAAERACHYSPHGIQGYTVFAEPYRGTGPTSGDRAIRAQAGLATSQTASPNTLSSTTMQLGASQSSATVSSATATASIPASMPPRLASEPLLHASGAFPIDFDEPTGRASAQPPVPIRAQAQPPARTTSAQPRPPTGPKLRIKNAKPVQFLPQEKAFLPAPPRWQQTLSSFPIIGWVIGSGHGIIGDQVPRKEDGSFDSGSASLYWRVWYMVDTCFGTDFCGVRDAEYEE